MCQTKWQFGTTINVMNPSNGQSSFYLVHKLLRKSGVDFKKPNCVGRVQYGRTCLERQSLWPLKYGLSREEVLGSRFNYIVM